MRNLLLSKRDIKKIAIQTSFHYKDFTKYHLDRKSLLAIQYIIARAYFNKHFSSPDSVFHPNIHPSLQEYLRALDFSSESDNRWERYDKEFSEASEASINRAYEKLENSTQSDENPQVVLGQSTDNQQSQSVTVNSDTDCTQESSDKLSLEFRLFDRDILNELREKCSHFDREIKRIIKEIPDGDTGIRPLKTVTEEFLSRLNILKDKYPNMNPFLEFVDRHAALSRHNPFHEYWMPPVLLVSAPGLGKTQCVKDVAKAIGVPFDLADFATISASFILVGSSSQWGGAKPGLIYDMLIKESNASNGIILCDEIDKSLFSGEKYPPINIFYRLLEKDIMREYSDEYIPQLKLDASRMMFVATANTLDGIPDAILSRFHVIHIDKPDEFQIKNVAKSIYQSIRETESYQSFSADLQDSVVDCLSKYSPRQIKVILKMAFATAAYRCRASKDNEPIALELEDLELPGSNVETRKIGFVWN